MKKKGKLDEFHGAQLAKMDWQAEEHIPLIIMRTLAIKLMIFPLTLWSGPDWPKAGS